MDFSQLLLQNIQEAYSAFVGVIVGFVPRIIAALLLGSAGLIVASGLGIAVKRVIEASQLDAFLKKLGLEQVTEQFNLKLNTGAFLGRTIEWIVIITTLIAVFDVLGLTSLNSLLVQLFEFLPNALVASVIMVASIIIARLAAAFVGHLLAGTKIEEHAVAVGMTKIGVIGFGILLALDQLGVASELIRILFAGMVFMVALAGGLAFGLGGKEFASGLLHEFKKEIGRH